MSRWLSQINQLDRRYRPLLHHETIAARHTCAHRADELLEIASQLGVGEEARV